MHFHVNGVIALAATVYESPRMAFQTPLGAFCL